MLALLALIAAQTAPDVELRAHATVREVRIRQHGEASLQVRAEPDGGSAVHVQAPPSRGERRLRNVTVDIHAEARLAPDRENRRPTETSPPR